MKLLILITVSLTLLVRPVFAEEHPHHENVKSDQLRLNAGKKWETDAPLRAGMGGIREALEPKLSAMHKNKLTNSEYAELSEQITAHVNSIFKNCRLSPKADQQLHLILVQIMDGASAMKTARKTGERKKGAFKIDIALKQYPKYFEHPEWGAREAK